jgi:hypothetical protein
MPQPAAFRDYIPTADWKFKKQLAESDAKQWAELRGSDDFVHGWKESWGRLYEAPFTGITTNGDVVPGLFHLAEKHEDYGAPTAAMVAAAEDLLSLATPDQRKTLSYPIDAPEWRRWMNPELYFFENGLRLEEISDELVTAVHSLLRASLSVSGYAKAVGCMKVNGFLGKIVDGEKVLNERSYNVAIYGVPSMEAPWGWHIYGHHLCLNFLVVGTQEVITPIFMGAEPNIIDEGPDKGTALFTKQEQAGVVLMQSLDADTRAHARIYAQCKDPAMPEGRHHRADQRHLGGAFQDNRVVPFEGIRVATLSQQQQDLVFAIIRLSTDYLPSGVQEARLNEVKAHVDETYFCWIGGWEANDTFYYKIHSPVIMIEFDHHTGVFLTNKEPLPFHIHTLVRTPNGNDYGKELVRLYQQKHNPHT